MRSRNQVTNLVDLALNLCLVVGVLVVLVQRARTGDVPWRFAVRLATVGAVLTFLAALNQFQMAVFHYDTTKSWGSFVGQFALSGLVQVVALFAVYVLLTAGSEPLYREHRPTHLPLSRLFTRQVFRTKSFLLHLV